MKINVKKKVMLAVLAGGMLCANGAFATDWYGSSSDATEWTSVAAQARATEANLSLDGTASHGISSFNGNDNFYAGYSNSIGGVTNNKLTIDGGNYSGDVSAGVSQDFNAESNQLIVRSGTFSGNVKIYGAKARGTASDNSVNIEGGTFSATAYELRGGYTSSGMSSGNTLNLKIKMGGKASVVSHFQIMNFTLPSDIADGTPMLKTTNMTFDAANTTINVDARAATLNDSDVITLIAYDNKTGNWTQGTITGGPDGWVISDTGNSIIFSLPGAGDPVPTPTIGDKEKAPVEGVAAAAAIVNASADLASGQGMASLIANTAGGATDTFGAMSAGSSKYKTGSHVDVDGWGVLVGAGKTKEWKDGSATTYGLFFEYGKGDFDTYNGNVHGDGNSENKGVGIMARHKLTNNTYYEGNIRYGKQETEWGQSDIGSYDTDSRYYGISVGVGHIYPAGKNEIDVYGRYTYGHVGACDATVGTSEYHFDSVKSHRVRVGGKYNFKVKDSNAKPYIGLAWEREFKGESKASIAGVGEAPAPSMKGNTGILEVGCDWNVNKKWTVGLGANAYVGKRKGWDGMARVFYNF